MEAGREWSDRVRAEVGKAVVGQEEVVDRMLVAMLADGHVLLEGMPGLAKTLLVKSLGEAMDVDFERVQFTPDLLPSDVVGTMILQPHTGEFKVHRGPIFANLVLADEINRAPAKVQSGLLEAMQERQVTIGEETHRLDQPFLVMATQNPIEQEGTYPLPEAQVDRFLFKLVVDYPSERDERAMMDRWGSVTEAPRVEAVSCPTELVELRELVDKVHVSDELQGYMLSLVRETRKRAGEGGGPDRVFSFGASPRASLALVQASRALAFVRGHEYVTPDRVQEVFLDAIRHRVGLTYEAEASERKIDDVLDEILETTPIPGAR